MTDPNLEERIAVLSDALKSIAKNTCCDNCQEAARVARAALGAYVGLARDHTGDVAQAVSESIPRASHTARQGGWRLDFDWLVGMQDGIEEATGYNITLECLEEAVVRTEAICTAAQPPADPVETERKTFTIPPGYEAVRDSEGRATGEVRPQSSADNGGDILERLLFMADVGLSGFHDPAIIGELRSAADEIKRLRAVPQSPLPASMALAFASERERLVETLDLTPGALISYLAGYDEATELALALSRPERS